MKEVAPKLNDASYSGAIITSSSKLAQLKELSMGNYSWEVLPRRIMTADGGMAFPIFHYFFEPFNELVDRIIPSGLTEHWTRTWFKSRYNEKKSTYKPPIVLTMNHLVVGFQVWLLCLLMSFVCFLYELISFRIRSRLIRDSENNNC